MRAVVVHLRQATPYPVTVLISGGHLATWQAGSP
jgi:hypothetical protein